MNADVNYVTYVTVIKILITVHIIWYWLELDGWG